MCGFTSGCAGVNPERTVLTANGAIQDAVDIALKTWASSLAKRQHAAEALKATNPVAAEQQRVALAREVATVRQAKADYVLAETTAINAWLAAKSLGTNAPPVAQLEAALASARQPILQLLSTFAK